MDSGDDACIRTEEQRDTVGCRYPKAHIAQACDDAIDTIGTYHFGTARTSAITGTQVIYHTAMHLSRHDESIDGVRQG